MVAENPGLKRENADFKFGTATLHLHKSPSLRDVCDTL